MTIEDLNYGDYFVLERDINVLTRYDYACLYRKVPMIGDFKEGEIDYMALCIADCCPICITGEEKVIKIFVGETV